MQILQAVWCLLWLSQVACRRHLPEDGRHMHCTHVTACAGLLCTHTCRSAVSLCARCMVLNNCRIHGSPLCISCAPCYAPDSRCTCGMCTSSRTAVSWAGPLHTSEGAQACVIIYCTDLWLAGWHLDVTCSIWVAPVGVSGVITFVGKPRT